MEDIAQKAGVSKTTISRFLNGKYEFMSAATRERILNVVKELNFHPNLMAQSLKSGQTKTIGVIVPDLLNPFYPEFIRGVGGLC
ncbi:MAG: LacI family DNA-binding transcriptional regulator, partial [Bacteroidota bacterium]